MRFARALTPILRDPRISRGAKALYCLLLTYCDAQGACWPSISTLCADLGDCDRKTVIADAAELEQIGVITRVPGKGKSSTTYMMNDAHFAKYLAKKAQKQAP